mgnify:CR=1 FL=1
MKVKIYLITDINGLKYVGSTINKYLCNRIAHHKCTKNNSSRLLDCNNWEYHIIEECEECDRKTREQYWIDNTVCVNKIKALGNKKQYQLDNKEYFNKLNKIYNETHKDEIKIYKAKLFQYQQSWGSIKIDNNLLRIDINLFN